MKYTNRYGDIYTFTLDEDGNILWEGNFEHCRYAFPNDYSKAWELFQEKYNAVFISYKVFKDLVHMYDNEKREYVFSNIVPLIKAIPNKISMVDPSGGPYISAGDSMGELNQAFEGYIVKEFERIDNGYKIICWGSVDAYSHQNG